MTYGKHVYDCLERYQAQTAAIAALEQKLEQAREHERQAEAAAADNLGDKKAIEAAALAAAERRACEVALERAKAEQAQFYVRLGQAHARDLAERKQALDAELRPMVEQAGEIFRTLAKLLGLEKLGPWTAHKIVHALRDFSGDEGFFSDPGDAREVPRLVSMVEEHAGLSNALLRAQRTPLETGRELAMNLFRRHAAILPAPDDLHAMIREHIERGQAAAAAAHR